MSPFPKLVPRGVVCCLDGGVLRDSTHVSNRMRIVYRWSAFFGRERTRGRLLLKNAGVETPSACAYAAHFDRHAR